MKPLLEGCSEHSLFKATPLLSYCLFYCIQVSRLVVSDSSLFIQSVFLVSMCRYIAFDYR